MGTYIIGGGVERESGVGNEQGWGGGEIKRNSRVEKRHRERLEGNGRH